MSSFHAWQAHRVSAEGVCVDCGLANIPNEAISDLGITFTHSGYFSPNPAGRIEPCRTPSDKQP